MRHGKISRRYGRDSAHRKAMLQNLVKSLLTYEAIQTTKTKAIDLKRIAERLITRAKKPTLHNRRLAFALLRDKELVYKLFNQIGPRYQDRPGGYLRVLKCGFRAGDRAPIALVEFV